MKNEVNFTVRIPKPLHAKLVKYQKKLPHHQSLNHLILTAMEEYLERETSKKGRQWK